ncbi:cell wall glycoside hydrolase YteR [Ceratobasidium sp. AG-Ba]|nr:cell wall glycoside hydrolase YteR [Ceratobasidium sp. AG-Ba]
MRSTTAVFLVAGAIGASAAQAPLSQRMADSAIFRAQGSLPPVRYETGVFQRSLQLLYEKTKNATYRNYHLKQVDSMVSSNGTIDSYNFTLYSLDPLRTGEAILYAYEQTNQAKYKTALDTFRAQLNSQPRTPAGAFWHRSTYPNQQWLDGVYMADIFYAAYNAKFAPQNTTAWNDIFKQFKLVEDNLRVNSTAFPNGAASGLLYHGYDASLKAVWSVPPTGHCLEVWDRALGWYVMALVDVLDIFPKSHPGWVQLQGYLQRLAPEIVKAADKKTGAWWLVLSQPGRAGNYIESSGSAMFVYSLLKGVRKGYLPKSNYVTASKKAYQYLVKTFVVPDVNGTLSWNGTVSVGSLGSNGTYEYYISVAEAQNDLKGLAPFVLASLEYEAL